MAVLRRTDVIANFKGRHNIDKRPLSQKNTILYYLKNQKEVFFAQNHPKSDRLKEKQVHR